MKRVAKWIARNKKSLFGCRFDKNGNPVKISFVEKVSVVITATVFNMLWIVFMINLLNFIFSATIVNKWSFWGWMNADIIIDRLSTMLMKSFWETFFFAVILAPLWEEFVFRLTPLYLMFWFNKRDKEKNPELIKKHGPFPRWIIIVLIPFILFGILHGSPINLFIQGVGGLFLTYVYLRNGNCFWSAVAHHALWNFSIIAFSYYTQSKSFLNAVTMPFWIFFQ